LASLIMYGKIFAGGGKMSEEKRVKESIAKKHTIL
jgi:hypothetical protein